MCIKLNADVTATDTTQARVTQHDVGNIENSYFQRILLHYTSKMPENTKVHLYAIREMMKVLTCGIHSTFLQLTSDQLFLSALILYIATKKEVTRTETHH